MKLSVGGIPQGKTIIEGELDPMEFSLAGNDARLTSPVRVSATVTKMGGDVYVDAEIDAEVEMSCSRCLDGYARSLHARLQMLYIPSGAKGRCSAAGGECGFYGGNTVDLAPAILDLIARELPRKPLCREDCRGLCPHCGAVLNEAQCGCAPPDTGYRPFEGIDLE